MGVALTRGVAARVEEGVTNGSSVGVIVGGSRVGIGAWVGVAGRDPVGRTSRVADAFAAGNVIWSETVGAASSINMGRTRKLNVPTQYKTATAINTITMQPYVKNRLGEIF